MSNSKVQKDYPEFVSEVAGFSIEQIKERLVSHAKAYEEVIADQLDNPKIIDAKDMLRDLMGPYKDTKKALRLKNAYLVELLEEKGGT